jgi:tetratricopeptide (TPR) repeat protein
MGSCGEDFLNLTPHSNANEEDFFRTQSEIETAMVGAYNSLYTVYGSLGVMYYFGALSSDDAYTDDRGTGAFEEFEIAQTKANNTEILNAWNSFYAAIARINKIIESTESLTFERKDSYIAEMKFLRALYYFNMTQIWGGVPLLTKNISISEAYSTGRASIDQMYEQIISDLKDATQHLSAKGSERSVGVPTKGAAYALLGKVYLTKGNKSEAAATLMNIYNNSYQLATDYADLWDLKKKNGVESIFEIQYMGGASNAPSTIGHCIHRQIILGLSRYKEADIIR